MRTPHNDDVLELLLLYPVHKGLEQILPQECVPCYHTLLPLNHGGKPFEEHWVDILHSSIGEENSFRSKCDCCILVLENGVTLGGFFDDTISSLGYCEDLSVGEKLDGHNFVERVEYFLSVNASNVLKQVISCIVHHVAY